MKIGVDLGGSHIGVGLIEEANIVASKDKILTREDRANIEEVIVNEITNMIKVLCKENKIKEVDLELIGIASPGTISNGVIVKAGNLGIKDFELVSKLKEKFNCNIIMRNDAKCAGMAEKVYGAMKNYQDGVFLCIGTGIGGAVFMDGKLLEPKRYSGFEMGHMVINKGGRLCSCGKRGCFETYASIKALKTKVTETLDIDSDISGEYLRETVLKREVFEKHNEAVIQDLEIFLDYLQTGICNYIDIFEPEVVVLGGSFSYYENNPIFDMLVKKIKQPKSTFNEGKKPKIVTAEFKNDAGIIGATLV
jgi:glucokinase